MSQPYAPSVAIFHDGDVPAAALGALLGHLSEREGEFVRREIGRKGKLLDGSAWLSGASARTAGMTWDAFLDKILVDAAGPSGDALPTVARVRGILAGFAAVAEIPSRFAAPAARELNNGVARLRVARGVDVSAVLGADVAPRVLAACARFDTPRGHQVFFDGRPGR